MKKYAANKRNTETQVEQNRHGSSESRRVDVGPVCWDASSSLTLLAHGSHHDRWVDTVCTDAKRAEFNSHDTSELVHGALGRAVGGVVGEPNHGCL